MSVRQPGLKAARQRAADTLIEHFANNVLDMTEFERRLDVVNRSANEAELNELIAYLPATDLPVPAPSVVPARGGAPVVVSADRVKECAYMVSNSRTGRWVPARSNFAIGGMGYFSLDFREAMLGPGVTDVNVFVLLDGAEIIVPPAMAVEVSGFAFMGGFDHDTDEPIQRDPDRPTLRIRGFAMMGASVWRCGSPGRPSGRPRSDGGWRRRDFSRGWPRPKRTNRQSTTKREDNDGG